MNPKRIRFDLVRLAKLSAKDGEPVWQMLLPRGTRHDRRYGQMDFTAEVLSAMEKNFKKLAAQYRGEDTFGLQVNFHHLGGMDLEPAAGLELTVAAGWIEDVQARGDGLYAAIRWTNRARELIQQDEFRYLSVECAFQWMDRLTGNDQGPTLFGAALTNTPAMTELPRVAASEVQPEDAKASDEGAKQMDLKKLSVRLGLAESATEKDVESKLTELEAAAKKAAETAEASKSAEGKVEKLTDLLKQSNARIEAAEAELKKQADANREAAASAFVEGLVKEGKIVPAQADEVKKLALSDLALAKGIYAKAPVVIALGERGHGGGGEGEDKVKQAQKKLDERIAELRKAQPTMSFSIAYDMALAEMPDVSKLLFSHTTKASALNTSAQ